MTAPRRVPTEVERTAGHVRLGPLATGIARLGVALEESRREVQRLHADNDQLRRQIKGGYTLGAPRRAQEDRETDVPDWVLELIRGLAKYEAEHPKLYRHKGVDQVDPYPCPCSLLEGVPKAIAHALAARLTRRNP